MNKNKKKIINSPPLRSLLTPQSQFQSLLFPLSFLKTQVINGSITFILSLKTLISFLYLVCFCSSSSLHSSSSMLSRLASLYRVFFLDILDSWRLVSRDGFAVNYLISIIVLPEFSFLSLLFICLVLFSFISMLSSLRLSCYHLVFCHCFFLLVVFFLEALPC